MRRGAVKKKQRFSNFGHVQDDAYLPTGHFLDFPRSILLHM